MPHLDLNSTRAVIAFLEDHLDLLPDTEQKRYRDLIGRSKRGERVPRVELAESAKALGAAIWPRRKDGGTHTEKELKDMQKRLAALRSQAERSEPAQQDLLLAKLAAFEDRVYFGGESIPLEILDAELAYDIADREVPPNEEPMM